ncbi:MAG: sulfur carrier protein ThiS, partial [Planctomycetes bacterium]|nr:sulfur carrier protein ThiS [Planctomycetota bacterium]
TINGELREFPDGLPHTLSDLLDVLSINQATIVAEVNEQIIKRTEFSKTPLTSGQAIELVRFVGGGSGLVVGD